MGCTRASTQKTCYHSEGCWVGHTREIYALIQGCTLLWRGGVRKGAGKGRGDAREEGGGGDDLASHEPPTPLKMKVRCVGPFQTS